MAQVASISESTVPRSVARLTIAGISVFALLCVALMGFPEQSSSSTVQKDHRVDEANVSASDSRSDQPDTDAHTVGQPSAPAAVEAHASADSSAIRLDPPRSSAELRAGLQALDEKLKVLMSRDSGNEREAALIRLRMYRFLCGLPEADLVLADHLNEEALAAAGICRQLDALTHAPTNPGLSPADYERAQRGAAASNLASGVNSLVRAIDGWIDDSDPSNIDTLGHRRWCLNPPLRQVGFGRTGGWCAMWAHDTTGQEPFRRPAICYPAPGPVPLELFRSNAAWSVSLNPRVFRRPRVEEIRVNVRNSVHERLMLDVQTLELSGYGIDNCIIFRPKDLSAAVGRRYEVTISGLQDHNERDATLSFEVEFVAL